MEDGIVTKIEKADTTQMAIIENSTNLGRRSFEIEDIEEQDEQNIAANRIFSPPFNYVCPLTLKLMENPACDRCGHTFERAAISDWLEYHSMCPISRRPMDSSDLTSSTVLQSRIQQWKVEHRAHFRENQVAGGHLPFEHMLLPQERSVLDIIKVRTNDRKMLQEHRKFLMTVLMASAVLLLLSIILSVQYLGLDLNAGGI